MTKYEALQYIAGSKGTTALRIRLTHSGEFVYHVFVVGYRLCVTPSNEAEAETYPPARAVEIASRIEQQGTACMVVTDDGRAFCASRIRELLEGTETDWEPAETDFRTDRKQG